MVAMDTTWNRKIIGSRSNAGLIELKDGKKLQETMVLL